jgi:two-component system cell cycle response regulator
MSAERGDRTLLGLTVAAALTLLALTLMVVTGRSRMPTNWEIPLLVVAWTSVLVVSLVLRRRRAPAPPEGDVLPRGAPDTGVPEAAESRVAKCESKVAERPPKIHLEELLRFTQDIHAAVQGDRLRTLVAQRLPELLGLRDVWVFARFGNRRHIITPADADGTLMRRLMNGEGDWATFPLKVDQDVVGVLGVGIPIQRFNPHERRLFSVVASILARALQTSDAFEMMREASIIDTLTGCLLRPEGLRRLDAELRRAERSSRPVALLLLDLDHFKSVNDRYGHNCGDAVLSAVGGIMMRTLRASDLRCRWGGEEFLIVLPESSIGPARRVAEALRQRIAEMRITCGAKQVTTTASIGVALAHPGELDTQQLVSRADIALYQAKNAGRNCVQVVLEDARRRPDAPAERWADSASGAASAVREPVESRKTPDRPARRRRPLAEVDVRPAATYRGCAAPPSPPGAGPAADRPIVR